MRCSASAPEDRLFRRGEIFTTSVDVVRSEVAVILRLIPRGCPLNLRLRFMEGEAVSWGRRRSI
jgi:hypothetical protein